MLPKKFRLPPKEFQRVYKRGVKARGEYGMLIGLKDETIEGPKFGFVVNSKIGNAVQRHAMTRRLREVAVAQAGELESPILFEYVAFKFTKDQAVLEKEFATQLQQVIKGLK